MLVAIFFLESLFPRGLALAESSKMIQLIGHFQEHVLESGNQISFTEFLWLHYNPTSDHENSEHHHEKLPNLNLHSSFVGFIYEGFSILTTPIFSTFGRQFVAIPEYKNGYRFLFSLDLLNPPQ